MNWAGFFGVIAGFTASIGIILLIIYGEKKNKNGTTLFWGIVLTFIGMMSGALSAGLA